MELGLSGEPSKGLALDYSSRRLNGGVLLLLHQKLVHLDDMGREHLVLLNQGSLVLLLHLKLLVLLS